MKIKTGDLVRWNHPHAGGLGIVLGIHENTWMGIQANIFWFEDKDTSGLYPVDHKHLELVSEDR